MIVHVFNTGVISGPETLVLPALPLFRERSAVVFITETRWGEKGLAALQFARKLGLEARQVEVRSRVDLRTVGLLKGMLQSLDARVVNAHDVKASSYTWLASHGERWRTVSTHHGIEGRPDWKSKAYELFYSHVVLPRMHMAVAVTRNDEHTLLLRGLNPQRVTFVANGVTRKKWTGEERERERARVRELWRQELGDFPADTCLLGVVARLSEEKRHDYLLRALRELRRARPELRWKLLAFGSGKLEGALKRATTELGLDGCCHWMGYRDDAASLLPGLDLAVLTSAAEGLPIVALEAGWAGVPLFTSNVGGLPELISTGKAAGGVVFPREQEPVHTAKSLAWLIEHPRERERLGLRLQNRVAREYSAEAWVERMETLYREI